MAKVIVTQFHLVGRRPLMFDRYAGDNKTSLPVAEKMYLDENQCLILPAINLFSMLVAENTKSVCKLFFGKGGKTIGLGISSFCSIEPYDLPICDDKGPIKFTGFNSQISVVKHVARLKGGVPNPKERPVLALPWSIKGTVTYTENPYCPYATLRDAFAKGGIIGLGTFRPYFGLYTLEQFEAIESRDIGDIAIEAAEPEV